MTILHLCTNIGFYNNVCIVFSIQEVTVKANKNVLKRNATQYLAIFTLPIDPKIGLDKAKTKYKSLMRSNKAIFSITPLTKHHIPEAETFQLLKGQEETVKSEKVEHRLPILHLKSKIKMGGMIDDIDIPRDNVPGNYKSPFVFGTVIFKIFI